MNLDNYSCEGQISFIDDIPTKPEKPLNFKGGVKLYNGDCQEILKNIPDKSVDLVVTDPPYEFIATSGAGAFGNKRGKAGLGRDYHDEYASVYYEKTDLGKRKKTNLGDLDHICKGFDFSILDECCRVMKKINIYVWCSKAQVRKLLDYFEDKGCFIDILTWHKTNPIPTCHGTYLNDTEYCIFAREKGVKVYGTYKSKFKYYVTPLNVSDKKLYGHPTIKPLSIIENLIINSSNENDTVLDCFMGSGTTGVACNNLGRNFIGIEIDKEYFEISKKRIENA